MNGRVEPKTFADAPIVASDGRYYRDITGVRFGGLVVLRREIRPDYVKAAAPLSANGKRRYNRKHWWYLQCDCGECCWSGVEQLRAGHKISCGCLRYQERPKPSPYTDEVIKRFTAPLPAGQSIAQLAAEIGITKGVAMGILDRAGLIGNKAKPPVLDFPKFGHCYWMHGEFGKEGFHWCGARCKAGESYCPEHRARIYTTIKPKQKEPETALAA